MRSLTNPRKPLTIFLDYFQDYVTVISDRKVWEQCFIIKSTFLVKKKSVNVHRARKKELVQEIAQFPLMKIATTQNCKER